MISEFLRRAGGIFSSLSQRSLAPSERWAGWLGCELDTQVCARHTVAIQSLLQRHILISHQYYGMRVCLALPLPALARYSQQSLFLHARERKRDAVREMPACLGLTPTILHAHSRGALSFLVCAFCAAAATADQAAMPILVELQNRPTRFLTQLLLIASFLIAAHYFCISAGRGSQPRAKGIFCDLGPLIFCIVMIMNNESILYAGEEGS